MKAYLISSDRDTLAGMRFAGIRGCLVRTREEADEAFRRACSMKELAILAVTERVAELAPETMQSLRERNGLPVVVEIPDRFGSIHGENYLADRVQEAIGVKMR